MKGAYQLTATARSQIEHIVSHIARDSTTAALRVVDDLIAAFGVIAEHPGFGHLREDLTDKPLRFYRVHNYLIVYRAEPAPVVIARVYHGAQDVASELAHSTDI
jgi:plasmid stabilization system protein ParE